MSHVIWGSGSPVTLQTSSNGCPSLTVVSTRRVEKSGGHIVSSGDTKTKNIIYTFNSKKTDRIISVLKITSQFFGRTTGSGWTSDRIKFIAVFLYTLPVGRADGLE